MIRPTVKTSLPALALLLGLAAPSVHAGSETAYGACSKNADGSGMCWGTFKGFKNHPDPNAYVFFTDLNSSGYRAFYGSLNGVNYSCILWESTTPADLRARWDRVMLARGYVQIEWNASGQCTALILQNGSNTPGY